MKTLMTVIINIIFLNNSYGQITECEICKEALKNPVDEIYFNNVREVFHESYEYKDISNNKVKRFNYANSLNTFNPEINVKSESLVRFKFEDSFEERLKTEQYERFSEREIKIFNQRINNPIAYRTFIQCMELCKQQSNKRTLLSFHREQGCDVYLLHLKPQHPYGRKTNIKISQVSLNNVELLDEGDDILRKGKKLKNNETRLVKFKRVDPSECSLTITLKGESNSISTGIIPVNCGINCNYIDFATVNYTLHRTNFHGNQIAFNSYDLSDQVPAKILPNIAGVQQININYVLGISGINMHWGEIIESNENLTIVPLVSREFGASIGKNNKSINLDLSSGEYITKIQGAFGITGSDYFMVAIEFFTSSGKKYQAGNSNFFGKPDFTEHFNNTDRIFHSINGRGAAYITGIQFQYIKPNISVSKEKICQ